MAYTLLGLTGQVGLQGLDTPNALARQTAASSDLELSDAERDNLRNLLEELMGFEGLSLSAKATDLITEHEHVFADVRIITDIRPVFGHDTESGLRGAVVVEMLRINHYTDGRVRAFHVALDSSDLASLKEAVDRAIDKTKTITDFMASAGLPYFMGQEDETDANAG